MLPAGGPVQFVVDTTGVADVRSLKMLRATDTQVARAVAEAIPRYPFYPAQLGSCNVKIYVPMPFSFRMQGYPEVPAGPVDGGYVLPAPRSRPLQTPGLLVLRERCLTRSRAVFRGGISPRE